jgi:hypothetical protein
MTNKPNGAMARRHFLRVIGTGATAFAASSSLSGEARAAAEHYQDKGKARYQPDSPEVQNFYRVNRYPDKHK